MGCIWSDHRRVLILREHPSVLYLSRVSYFCCVVLPVCVCDHTNHPSPVPSLEVPTRGSDLSRKDTLVLATTTSPEGGVWTVQTPGTHIRHLSP